MSNSFYLENRFLERMVDRQKQLYLRDKKEFVSVIIPFKGHKAWIIPLVSRDVQHKRMLVQMIAAGFAAKDIERFGYFFDGWTAPPIPVSDLEGLSPEEKQAKLKERRAALPEDFSKADFEGRGESISWGLVDMTGQIKHTFQRHDSKTHTLLSKALSDNEVAAEMHIFDRLLQMAKAADFQRSGVGKLKMWDMFAAYMRQQNTPITEVDLRQ